MQFRRLMLTLAAIVLTEPHSAWEWFLAIFNIVWIDIVLAGRQTQL
jgi:hypothetical protein